MIKKNYLILSKHYEECLLKYGDTNKGNDWLKDSEANKRYKIMMELIPENARGKTNSLLDFGCGTSKLYEYLKKRYLKILYSGFDISEKYIEISKNKFPKLKYYCFDILNDNYKLPKFDYIVINGVFTQKIGLKNAEMFDFIKNVLKELYRKINKGMAFNVMSNYVDWKTKENFYLSFETLSSFIIKDLSRNFIIRHDYGLYEYTTYIYK